MRNQNDSSFADLDWSMVIIYFLLVGLGITNIYSSVYDPEHPALFDQITQHGKQITWLGISLFLGITIMFLETSFIKKYAYWFYWVTIVLLVAVLFTPPVNGARAWFGIGAFGIQPAEFAKIGVALALAKYLSTTDHLRSRGLQIKFSLLPGITFTRMPLPALLMLIIPALLILAQPDAGTFIIFTSFILVLYREGYAGNILLFLIIAVIIAVITLVVADSSFMIPGLKIKLSGKTGIVLSLVTLSIIFYFLIRSVVLPRNRPPLYRALIGSLIVAVIFVNFIEIGYSKILMSHQKERIDLVLGKIDDPDGKGYNINRAKAAIGSGGFFGKGYMKATLANENQGHVPMQSTDFIFCTWSEEWGFIGSFSLVLIYTFLLIKMIVIAERQRSDFTRIFAYCVTGIFFYHFMINVGMAIGLAPVIGIPLPFFSYGGSSMMSFSILYFILLKLDAERKVVLQ
ncbi:MAG: rod shape-determining protein RodA [Bacteroidetes bacterium]|nr:rod shape-determining protein RodA [Bacteroidota bacterium]